jgi:hypothetical protein
MADTDISSHQVNGTDTESPKEGDEIIGKTPLNRDDSEKQLSGVSGLDDEAAIPKGTIDPVYEAKARVLNHAVCANTLARAQY